MKEHKKAAGGGTPTAGDRNERICMEYSTEKPKAQGVIEYGHFRAEVKVYSAGEIRYRIEMVKPMETTKYDEYYDYTRWEQELKREIDVLNLRISNFEFDFHSGRIAHAV